VSVFYLFNVHSNIKIERLQTSDNTVMINSFKTLENY